jgi:gas vesicle protein
MNTAGKVMVGVLAGATVGLLTGILIAPDSGKKTREKLLGKSKDLKNKVTESFDDVKKAYNQKVEAFAGEGKSRIDYLKDTLKV